MTINAMGFAKTFMIGGDLLVNRIGYGAMRLTGQPGNFGPYADWEAGQKLLHRAVELGVNFIDTAEAYGPGFNEELIASALYPYSQGIVIATKGGIYKPAPNDIRADGTPESLRRSCEASLQRLKVEQIDLYQLHRPDPNVPFLDSVSMLSSLQQEGKVRHIGLSNIALEQLKEARKIVAIEAVQNRLSIVERSSVAVLEYCQEQNIAFIPYGSLGAHPLKRGAPLATSEGILADIARRHDVKPSQVALAWLLHRAPNTVLIPGTTTIAHLEENIAATSIQLTVNEFEILNQLSTAENLSN
ncbi:aldo/keto reductase [Leptolyngbya sp. FACHB-261]|uniref:aldo/keto reductase n=1 Tax=Leptolyngbya sp. FACHB-261 TaxID=2692806 RepID=UPI00168389B8|nr:aldo/keto reductase [Leptolyngbya sp. FACHB-261]MBD2102474.1 aldo/keto reductase [Leptolyngbya sp. FACHB-261]